MRVLIIHYNWEYYNLTTKLWPMIFGDCHMTFFGPGFVSEQELVDGLKEFVKKRPKYDFIILFGNILLDYSCAFNDDVNKQISDSGNNDKEFIWHLKNKKRNSVIRFDRENAFGNAKRLVDDVIEIDGPKKIVTFYQYDHYKANKELLDFMKKYMKDFYFMGNGNEFQLKKSQTKDLNREKFYNKVTDHWIEYVTQKQNRVISLPHFISDQEFYFGELFQRKFNWSVLGAPYYAREKAVNHLSENKIQYISRNNISRIFSYCQKKGIKLTANPLLQSIYIENFREIIKNTKFCYTAGSQLRNPIRKYFEIPALGSLLVCQPCNGFERLGFKNMANSIVCEPEQLPEINDYLLNNLGHAQEIAREGISLIWSKHSTHARRKQVRVALEHIKCGKFNGSYWENGDFKIIE